MSLSAGFRIDPYSEKILSGSGRILIKMGPKTRKCGNHLAVNTIGNFVNYNDLLHFSTFHYLKIRKILLSLSRYQCRMNKSHWVEKMIMFIQENEMSRVCLTLLGAFQRFLRGFPFLQYDQDCNNKQLEFFHKTNLENASV